MKLQWLLLFIFAVGLGSWIKLPAARGENFTEVVGVMPYMKAKAGSYGFGGGVRYEMIEQDGFGYLPVGSGVEFGFLYFERVLRAGGVKFGYSTFHIPITYKYHFLMNYVAGLGYSADLSLDNRSMIYGPKASFGYITDTGPTLFGTTPVNFAFELQYLHDVSQKGTMSAWMLSTAVRY